MQVAFSDDARAYLARTGNSAVTITSVLFSSCCSGPLPPAVKPGAPQDPTGFAVLDGDGIPVFFDSLLDERPVVTIDLKDYGRYRELFVQGWE